MQYAQRVLAMVAGNPREFVEDLAAFPPACRPITFPNRLLEFSPCRHAQSPRHLLRHPRSAALMLGSSLREATTRDPVTKIVSQCDLCKKGSRNHQVKYPKRTADLVGQYKRLLRHNRPRVRVRRD